MEQTQCRVARTSRSLHFGMLCGGTRRLSGPGQMICLATASRQMQLDPKVLASLSSIRVYASVELGHRRRARDTWPGNCSLLPQSQDFADQPQAALDAMSAR